MRGAAASMTVLRPRDAREALRLFAARPEAVPLVGGTDFMVAWNLGLLNDRVMLDLSRLREWARITRVPGGLRIGALATHTAVQRHPIVRERFPLLVEACATIGGLQIQNRGTIGGNIANASPAGDTFPPLAVYEARILVSRAGARTARVVPFLDIFAGVKKTTLAPGELIEAIELPFPRALPFAAAAATAGRAATGSTGATGFARATAAAGAPPDRQMFRKVGTRAAQAISKTVGAGLLWLTPDGRVREVRLAFGSMAPTVRRLTQVEAALTGQPLTPRVVRDAVARVADDVSPIDDVRSTALYRLVTAQRLIEAFLLFR